MDNADLKWRIASILNQYERQCRHDELDRIGTQPWEFVNRILAVIAEHQQKDEPKFVLKVDLDTTEAKAKIDALKEAFNEPSEFIYPVENIWKADFQQKNCWYINGRIYYYDKDGEIYNAELDAIKKYGEQAVRQSVQEVRYDPTTPLGEYVSHCNGGFFTVHK